MGSNSRWKIKKRTMQRYNETVGIYERRYQEEQKRKYSAVLEMVTLPKGSCILDIGCGTGLFIEELHELGCHIIGVDLSRNMVALAKAKNKCGGLSIFFLVADADHLPFMDNIFDTIFSFTLLQNMPHPEETVVEASRVAKAGSMMILTASKSAFTNLKFTRLLKDKNLSLVKFIDIAGLNDYVAICRVLG